MSRLRLVCAKMPVEPMVALPPQHPPSITSESLSTQPTNFVARWREHANRALDKARNTLLDGGQAMDVVRYTDVAKTATDTYLVLEGRPTEVVQHIHTVDLEGIGLKLQAALARVMQGASVAPARPVAIDATFVPLDLGGPMGRHHDVGTSSGVPRRQSAALQHDALRSNKGGDPTALHATGASVTAGGRASGSPTRRRKVYPKKPGNHSPAALDPANPLKKARFRLNRRAARLAKMAAKEAQP